MDIKKVGRGAYGPLKDFSRTVAAEGAVLLKNNGVLPLKKGETVSLFGRIQTHYYNSGTGSGGMVNTDYVLSLRESFESDTDFNINKNIAAIYDEWIEKNPFDEGNGWATEPYSQKEMPLDEEVVKKAAKESETAVIILGRLSGEDRDNTEDKGSYNLTDGEEEVLKVVSKYFGKTCVLINSGNIIDMKWVEKYDIDAVMYLWQGGERGALAAADLISGRMTPCGKLTDTIAADITDYPAYKNFGDDNEADYEEDIYVGYRYFETFAKDKVVYPFGFGLSYTSFEKKPLNVFEKNGTVTVEYSVKNTGSMKGKEAVQIYFSAPSGKMGRPVRELIAYGKTKLLNPGEQEKLTLSFDVDSMAAFDDMGVTGNKSCFVLEEGEYKIFGGGCVRCAEEIYTHNEKETRVTEKLSNAMGLKKDIRRIRPDKDMKISYETVKASEEILTEDIPCETEYTGDRGIKLKDVYENKNTLDEFTAQLNDEDLAVLIRGEGMNCPKVTPGTGSALGGLSPSLEHFGIPVCCTTDGPSGIRMDSGFKATSIPSGTLLASTFDIELVEKIYELLAVELYVYDIDALLGPGINIHRNPLNGRNFEYMSEDPYLSGTMAASQAKGIAKYGATATIKHFCCNNQEHRRSYVNANVSGRALREIYLRPFEIAVKGGNVKAVMTAYNPVNGVYSSSNYGLNTAILRNDWGYKGIVMTDWWAFVGDVCDDPVRWDTKAMTVAQNDLYMVTFDAAGNGNGDNTAESLKNGSLKRGQIQRNVKNILKFILESPTFRKFYEGGCVINKAEKINFSNMTKTAEFKNLKMGDRVKASFDESGEYFLRIKYKVTGGDLSQYVVNFIVDKNNASNDTISAQNGETVEIKKSVNFIAQKNVPIGFNGSDFVTVESVDIFKR